MHRNLLNFAVSSLIVSRVSWNKNSPPPHFHVEIIIYSEFFCLLKQPEIKIKLFEKHREFLKKQNWKGPSFVLQEKKSMHNKITLHYKFITAVTNL